MFRLSFRVIRTSLLIGGVIVAQTAFASTPSGSYSFFSPIPKIIQEADSGFRLGIGQVHQHYVESTPSSGTLDQEHGSLRSFTLAMNGQGSHAGVGFLMNYVSGNDHYNGALQYYDPSTGTMQSTPMQSTTKNMMFDMRVHFDLGFSPLPHTAIIPLVFGGFHAWHRQITGVGAVTENYIDFYYGGGLKLQYAIDSFVLSATGRYGTTTMSKMKGSNATFNLGSMPWYSAGLRLTYVPLSWLKAYIGDTYTGFGYGASNTVPIGGGFYSSEPHSRTQQNLIEVGIILF